MRFFRCHFRNIVSHHMNTFNPKKKKCSFQMKCTAYFMSISWWSTVKWHNSLTTNVIMVAPALRQCTIDQTKFLNDTQTRCRVTIEFDALPYHKMLTLNRYWSWFILSLHFGWIWCAFAHLPYDTFFIEYAIESANNKLMIYPIIWNYQQFVQVVHNLFLALNSKMQVENAYTCGIFSFELHAIIHLIFIFLLFLLLHINFQLFLIWIEQIKMNPNIW